MKMIFQIECMYARSRTWPHGELRPFSQWNLGKGCDGMVA